MSEIQITKKRKKKNSPWLRPHHGAVRNIAAVVLYPFVRFLYGARVRRFEEQGNRQYLIFMNHQTAFDQFFVGLAFRGPVYYISSEDLFSKGLLSKLIKFLVAPIPIKKQTTDPRAVINCIKVAREGGTIAMAPEGNRTYHGKSVYIKPSVVPLAKKLGMPIAIFKIEGGYGVHPRWSDVVRGGSMECGVSRVIEPEEYLSMSNEEMYDLLVQELYVDETKIRGSYPHKKNAEYLERAIYTCPICGFSKLESHGKIIRCCTCGLEAEHTDTKELVSKNENFNFHFVADWYDYQTELVSRLSVDDYKEFPMFRDTVRVWEEVPYKKKLLLEKEAKLELYTDKIILGSKAYPFSEIAGATVLGKNKLNIYHDGRIYQFKGDKRFCALKYVNIFTHYKNLTAKTPALVTANQKEEINNDREFLGF